MDPLGIACLLGGIACLVYADDLFIDGGKNKIIAQFAGFLLLGFGCIRITGIFILGHLEILPGFLSQLLAP